MAVCLLSAASAGAEPLELVPNGDFSSSEVAWFAAPEGPEVGIQGGKLCATVGGATSFGTTLVSPVGPLQAGEQYRLSLKLDGQGLPPSASVSVVGLEAPFPPVAGWRSGAEDKGRSLRFHFSAPADFESAAIAVSLGGVESFTVCLDDVSLLTESPYAPDTGPRVRVNQVGYLPDGPKAATLVTTATEPLRFRVRTRKGKTALRGRSMPRGLDATSGLNVHELRFDQLKKQGGGFTVEVDGETSHPFDVRDSVYRDLRTDSLALFYPQRSGIAIEEPYVSPQYARAAGHVGVAPNQGDFSVPCQPPEVSEPIYGEPWTCDYTLDVHGGWYDAGDHGKYVVAGGIAVAQLMSTYERALYARGGSPAALGDGSLSIPEEGNGVPDILDEARWQLEWMMRMQVPAAYPLAGMVHHKVHDFGWTGLPLAPAADGNLRELHRPSTAATLNLAAAAAQGARLFEAYDPGFAEQLLEAARKAFAAAEQYPELYAPGADGSNGGGPYNDDDASDEHYWAAAELYLTTGEKQYKRAVLASPHHHDKSRIAESTEDEDENAAFSLNGFSWRRVAALGRLDLATVPNRLPDRRRVRRSVLRAADALLDLAKDQPWAQPYAPTTGSWAWGSNYQVLNNLQVLAVAHDLSGSSRYRRAALEGMDYILGRNALGLSYVTGYGEAYSENQHSRMYAAQFDGRSPHPPLGTLAGGPNSSIQDPFAQGILTGCAPQLCYVDDISSWSTNELTVYWNAALVWMASYAADQENASHRAGGDCARGRDRLSGKRGGSRSRKARRKERHGQR